MQVDTTREPVSHHLWLIPHVANYVVRHKEDIVMRRVAPTAVPLMRTSVKMLSEAMVDQPSICAAAEQAGAAGTGSFETI